MRRPNLTQSEWLRRELFQFKHWEPVGRPVNLGSLRIPANKRGKSGQPRMLSYNAAIPHQKWQANAADALVKRGLQGDFRTDPGRIAQSNRDTR